MDAATTDLSFLGSCDSIDWGSYDSGDVASAEPAFPMEPAWAEDEAAAASLAAADVPEGGWTELDAERAALALTGAGDASVFWMPASDGCLQRLEALYLVRRRGGSGAEVAPAPGGCSAVLRPPGSLEVRMSNAGSLPFFDLGNHTGPESSGRASGVRDLLERAAADLGAAEEGGWAFGDEAEARWRSRGGTPLAALAFGGPGAEGHPPTVTDWLWASGKPAVAAGVRAWWEACGAGTTTPESRGAGASDDVGRAALPGDAAAAFSAALVARRGLAPSRLAASFGPWTSSAGRNARDMVDGPDPLAEAAAAGERVADCGGGGETDDEFDVPVEQDGTWSEVVANLSAAKTSASLGDLVAPGGAAIGGGDAAAEDLSGSAKEWTSTPVTSSGVLGPMDEAFADLDSIFSTLFPEAPESSAPHSTPGESAEPLAPLATPEELVVPLLPSPEPEEPPGPSVPHSTPEEFLVPFTTFVTPGEFAVPLLPSSEPDVSPAPPAFQEGVPAPSEPRAETRTETPKRRADDLGHVPRHKRMRGDKAKLGSHVSKYVPVEVEDEQLEDLTIEEFPDEVADEVARLVQKLEEDKKFVREHVVAIKKGRVIPGRGDDRTWRAFRCLSITHLFLEKMAGHMDTAEDADRRERVDALLMHRYPTTRGHVQVDLTTEKPPEVLSFVRDVLDMGRDLTDQVLSAAACESHQTDDLTEEEDPGGAHSRAWWRAWTPWLMTQMSSASGGVGWRTFQFVEDQYYDWVETFREAGNAPPEGAPRLVLVEDIETSL